MDFLFPSPQHGILRLRLGQFPHSRGVGIDHQPRAHSCRQVRARGVQRHTVQVPRSVRVLLRFRPVRDRQGRTGGRIFKQDPQDLTAGRGKTPGQPCRGRFEAEEELDVVGKFKRQPPLEALCAKRSSVAALQSSPSERSRDFQVVLRRRTRVGVDGYGR